MTIQEILNAQKGYIERETRRYREEWERVRWQAAVYANSMGGKTQPTDLIKFPWEDVVAEIRKTDLDIIEERRKARKK